MPENSGLVWYAYQQIFLLFVTGVWNQWNGMMEWTTGMEHCNGIPGWTWTRSLRLQYS